MLCDLDLPLLFVDSPVMNMRPPLKADVYKRQGHAWGFSFRSISCGFAQDQVGFRIDGAIVQRWFFDAGHKQIGRDVYKRQGMPMAAILARNSMTAISASTD